MAKKADIAGVVVRDELGRYLLIQEAQLRAYGLWNMPAGHIDAGESPQQAALREGLEETGFTMELLSEEPILVDTKSNPTHTFHAFTARITGGELHVPEDEILDAGWFSFAEVKAKDAAGEIRSPWITEAITRVEKQHSPS